MKERIKKMIEIIEKRDYSYYNKNSMNNYMKVERKDIKKVYDYESEREMYLSFKLGRIKKLKNQINELKDIYKKFMNLFNIRQLDLLKSKNDHEFTTISEHLEYLKLKRKTIENDIRIKEKELYILTHPNG